MVPLIPNTDRAWAAGFFDGEGCTSIDRERRERKGNYLRLAVQQKDPRPLERLSMILGGRVRPFKTRECYNWALTGRPALKALSMIWGYLSEPKREQATRVLSELGLELEEVEE